MINGCKIETLMSINLEVIMKWRETIESIAINKTNKKVKLAFNRINQQDTLI